MIHQKVKTNNISKEMKTTVSLLIGLLLTLVLTCCGISVPEDAQQVNRKALPAPVIQASDREYVEPSNEQERMFAKIFGDILQMTMMLCCLRISPR